MLFQCSAFPMLTSSKFRSVCACRWRSLKIAEDRHSYHGESETAPKLVLIYNNRIKTIMITVGSLVWIDKLVSEIVKLDFNIESTLCTSLWTSTMWLGTSKLEVSLNFEKSALKSLVESLQGFFAGNSQLTVRNSKVRREFSVKRQALVNHSTEILKWKLLILKIP